MKVEIKDYNVKNKLRGLITASEARASLRYLKTI